MLFQREVFCFCNSPVAEIPFPGRVKMTFFSPAFFKDSVHSHCLTCPLSLEDRVKETEVACLLHPHLICRPLCHHRNGNHVFLPLQSALLAFPCSRLEFQYILYTKRWGFYMYFRTRGWVCRRCTWRNSNFLGYCRPASECAKNPAPVHSCTGILDLSIKHKIVTFSQKIYLLETVQGVFGRKKTSYWVQDLSRM